jgi:hypothetical protein
MQWRYLIILNKQVIAAVVSFRLDGLIKIPNVRYPQLILDIDSKAG